jgi:predicted RNA binding protein YcfA (HicA-like mRNA interferase family)
MGLRQDVWNQVKNLTADEIISALKKDGWERDTSSRGAILAFIKHGTTNQRITIHYHPKKTYGSKLLQALIKDIGWGTEDLRRLKLIK